MTAASDLANRDYQLSLGIRLTICLAAFVIAALPLMLVEHLPFVDYPNHLARFYIWQNLDSSEHLSKYYQRQGGLHPYWAMHLIVNGLSSIVGLETAGRAFVILATLMPAIGACCVGWVLARRITLLPLASLSVTYNYLVAWGFHNYLFAGGFALVFFAMWIALQTASSWQRVAVMSVAALLLAVMHLLSVAILALLIFAWDTATIFVSRQQADGVKLAASRYLQLGLILLPAALFYLALDASTLGDNTTADGGLLLRFVSLMSPFMLYGADTDPLFSAPALLLLVAAVGAGAFNLSRHAIVMILVMVAVALAAPAKVYGVAISWRIPLFLVVLVFAVASVTGREARIRNGVSIVIAILLCLRVFDVTIQLNRHSGKISELLAAADVLQPGSRVLPAFGAVTSQYFMVSDHDQLAQYAAYLIPPKEIMFPLLFRMYEIGPRQQYAAQMPTGAKALRVTELGHGEAFFDLPRNRTVSYARNWRQHYDYLLVFGTIADEKPVNGTDIVHQGSYFQLRRISANSSKFSKGRD